MSKPDHIDDPYDLDALDLDALTESAPPVEPRSGVGAETSNLIHAFQTADQETRRRIRQRILDEGADRADEIVAEETGLPQAD